MNSIRKKITIGILLTLVSSILIVGLLSSHLLNNSFEGFLQTQEAEGFGYGRGRNQSDEKRLERYQTITSEFQNNIVLSLIVSSFFGFIISIGVGLYISNRISNPLKVLQQKLVDMRQNRYKKLDIETDTVEIIKLAEAYNKLIDELARIESLREDLVSDVAHELKTPLTKVIGQLEGCADGLYECDKSHLTKILENAYQIGALIDSLQRVVEIKAKKYELTLDKVKLSDFVESIISGLSKDSIKILNRVRNDVIIKADKDKLREIFDNLLSNAIRHTEKGEVTIDYDSTSSSIKICDTGEGIEKKDLPYIFERFYRGDKSRSKETGGFGLGLAIVSELVEAHGWSISVTSKIKRGTCFSISLN